MKIVFVKKILEDGAPCPKCVEVSDRLEREGLMARIDQTLIADARDPHSAGMQLAKSLSVDRAPFFVVEHEDGSQEVHTVFFKFMKDVLKAPPPGA